MYSPIQLLVDCGYFYYILNKCKMIWNSLMDIKHNLLRHQNNNSSFYQLYLTKYKLIYVIYINILTDNL